jgi:hypothetical protein
MTFLDRPGTGFGQRGWIGWIEGYRIGSDQSANLAAILRPRRSFH